MNEFPIFEVDCHEPEGVVTRRVYRMKLTPQNVQTFWEKARKFKHLFGHELRDNFHEFVATLVSGNDENDVKANGLFYRIDDFVGIFYMTDIGDYDAKIHYTFFDRRHKGRVDLVKSMIHYVFERYNFHRLTAEIPLFATRLNNPDEPAINQGVLNFVQVVGLKNEGRKREAALFDDRWFDVQYFGILRSETEKWVLNIRMLEAQERDSDKTSPSFSRVV